MAERLPYVPNEDDPRVRLNFADGSEFWATRENATLFTFIGLGRAAFNHIFLERQSADEEGKVTGSYIFSTNNAFKDLSEYMIKNNYPMHLNQTEVPACDVDAWERTELVDLESTDSFPADWDNAS